MRLRILIFVQGIPQMSETYIEKEVHPDLARSDP